MRRNEGTIPAVYDDGRHTVGHKVTAEVGAAVERMRSELLLRYGTDFAFTVVAGGNVIATSNMKDGVIYANRPKGA